MSHVPVALEGAFPIDLVNAAAERESWRKEVHRPATHTHKWWAQRLGSVFRGLVAASLTSSEADARAVFRGTAPLSSAVVYDPFAGSGTTLVEAVKLGCKAVGQDINPVATLVQRQAVAQWDRETLDAAFATVAARVRREIDGLHVTSTGETVLYYFWVAVLPCPSCPAERAPVELFSNYVFAKHAYVKRRPRARATCPRCHTVVVVDAAQDTTLTCGSCGCTSALQGPVKGASFTCPDGHTHRIVETLGGQRPHMQMYAKLVLGRDGEKRYEPIDSFDLDLYELASKRLVEHRDEIVLPVGRLEKGHNTRQAMAWGYHAWEDFFNDRQLYGLGLLGAAVRDLPASPEREALAALFSGTLEFNNLFCSFKGEGTGAVRHMFSHHVLKPERVPLEAHPWGTPSSSGSFSTLYRSRIIRALEYKLDPHDIVGEERVRGVSQPLTVPVFTTGAELMKHSSPAVMITTGSSAAIGLPNASVDAIITDPPFFDNVHYSELADFFHAWLVGLHPFDGYPLAATTRSEGEVQHTEAEAFGKAIGAVWVECARVLKPGGVLAFTFHQSKDEGWEALVRALRGAGFMITAVQPVKAEMSTASPKSGASDPSNLDSVVVCRLAADGQPPTAERAVTLLRRCRDSGVAVGWSDVQSVVRGSVLAAHTWSSEPSLAVLSRTATAAADAACLDLGLVSARVTDRRRTGHGRQSPTSGSPASGKDRQQPVLPLQLEW